MRKGFIFGVILAATIPLGAAHAGLIGQKIQGTIALGPDGADDEAWNKANDIIGSGLEFQSLAGGNLYGANFANKQLIITDMERPKETSSGWQMTFQLLGPAEFKNITLVSSNFGDNFTYSLVGNVMTANWTGDEAYAAMTRKERREVGVERFRAVFRVTTQDEILPVPEPATLPLLMTGLLGAATLGWRRRKTVA